MPDMREGDLGTAACYLMVERLALQAGVESPFWDEASLLMSGYEKPWYKKPLTPCRLRLFLKRYGGSLLDDGEQYGLAHAAHHDRIPETFASSDDLDEPWDDWICPCRG